MRAIFLDYATVSFKGDLDAAPLHRALPGIAILWLVVLFASFGLFTPRHATAIVVLFLGAVSLSAAIFLIEELNSPLQGFVTISRAPMDLALGFLGR